MKTLLFTLALVCISAFTYSQNPMSVGQSQFNIGLGLSDAGVPVYIGFDRAILPDLTIGAEASYRNYHEKWESNNYDHNIVGLSANLNYHFNSLFGIAPRWDVYAGANAGFYIWTSPDGYSGTRNSGLGLGAQIGTRYYFTNRVGINLEFGGGNAFTGGKLGLTFRL